MQVTAIYPGTFDPMTLGHIDIARRAGRMFDKLIIAVAASTAKGPYFTLDERVEQANQIMSEHVNIEIRSFSGLLVDFASQVNASVIVRGLRAISDFDYEVQIAGMNRQLDPTIETVFISASQDYTFISSSIVREIASHGGDFRQFVHPVVQQAFEEKPAH